MALRTVLTKRLGLRYPVIAAPLGRGSTPEFLGALAHQGAMGFVGLHMPEPEVRQILSGVIRNSTLTRWEQAGRPAPGARPGEGERIGTLPDGSPMLRYNVSAPWALMEADWEAGPHYAGASAALVHTIEPIATIL